MLRYASALLLGGCALHLMPRLPAPWPWLALCGVLLLASLRWRARLIPCALVGFAWAWTHVALQLADDLPASLEGEDLAVTGFVASLVERVPGQTQFLFEVSEAPAGVPDRLQLSWYDGAQAPHPGERWQLEVRLKRRNGFANAGGFDYEAHLFRQRIGATGYVREHGANRRLDEPAMKFAVLRARDWIAGRIAAASGPTPMLGILQGLAVGDTRAMQPDQWRVLAASGTTHLMAISGLHITMVAALAALLGKQIGRWRGAQARGITAIHGQVLAGALAALSYSLLAGWSVPTQRTLAMLVVFGAARWQRRELAIGDAFGLALVAVLLVDPFAPLSIGAWLSFGAVGVIVLAMAGRLRRDGVFRAFGRVQWAITIGLLPVIALAFGNSPLLAPLANVIAVPAFTLLIVPLTLVGTAAACVWLPAGSVVLGLSALLLNAAWPALEWIAAQPAALWYFAQPTPVALLAVMVGAALLILPGIAPLRLAGIVLCLPLFCQRPTTPPPGSFTLTVLDVGQGLAAVVHTHAHILLYDTGPAFRSGRDTGELVVLPYLRNRGVQRIDALVVSHGDADHDGGTRSVLTSVSPARVLLGPSVPVRAAQSQTCHRGERWQWDGVAFEVLHPGDGVRGDNDSSCVLLVRGPHMSVLLTGDIEAQAERQLLPRLLRPVDVVVIPHHGSRTSSTAELVAALRPSVAVVSAGYRNRWGFPKPDVVQRWQAIGARVFNTSESGAISVANDGEGEIGVDEYRRSHARYWSRTAAQ